MEGVNKPREYPFPSAPNANAYRLFPDDMENDGFIFFHGTAEKNLAPIVNSGFIKPDNLSSISFARNSDLSLRYACEKRDGSSPCGVVLAVRYACLDKPYIVQEGFGLCVYDFSVQPRVIAYCIVPENYVYS